MKKVIVCPGCEKDELYYDYDVRQTHVIMTVQETGDVDIDLIVECDLIEEEKLEEAGDFIHCPYCDFEEHMTIKKFIKKYPQAIKEVLE